jgi:threonine dehydratase
MIVQSKLSLTRIEEAARVIDPVFLHSPQFVSDSINAELGLRLLCKVECVNPIRSFKGRGADYFVHSLGSILGPLVTASAGNFGQGMAYACRSREVPLVVFAAESASQFKINQMRALGAEVRLVGVDFDDAKKAAREFAMRQGLRFVEDGREPAIAEGAGTIGIELSSFPEPIDALFVPVGNGALISGVGRWLKAVSPTTRLVGVVAEQAPAMRLSWLQGLPVSTDQATTIADGIAIREPVVEALFDMSALVDDIVAVNDEQLLDGARLAFRRLGLLVEPAGAAGIAGALSLRGQLQGRFVATILGGGNVSREQFNQWFLPWPELDRGATK